MSCPPNSIVIAACANASPSNTGTDDVSPAPHSTTTPEVRPAENTHRAELFPMHIDGARYASNKISAHFALSDGVARGDSANNTDVVSGEVTPTSSKITCHSFSI